MTCSDKAIDLVDEACANARVELDSQPALLDQLERRILQLEVESTALEQEEDPASQSRLRSAQTELSNLREELGVLRTQYEKEKQDLNQLAECRQEIEGMIR